MKFSIKCEINSLVAAVVDAYLTRRAGVAALRVVLKLHCVADPGCYLKLNRHELTALRAAVPAVFQEPIYPWLGIKISSRAAVNRLLALEISTTGCVRSGRRNFCRTSIHAS
jgi:hypothetical protein